MLTVHHLGHSQSDRIVWLCEELEIPYELKKYDRAPLFSPDAYKALHPLGAAPVIEDGPVTLAESEACVEWIANVHGGGRLLGRPGAANYAAFLYWYHITNGTLMPTMLRVMALRSAGVAPDHPTSAHYDARFLRVLRLYDDRLADNAWLAGDEFTAADIMVLFSFTTLREFTATDLSDFPNIVAYAQRAVERPAYKRYLQKADPDIDIAKYIQSAPPPIHPALSRLSE